MAQPYYTLQHEAATRPPFIIVDQRPRQENRFPINLNVNTVFAFAILKCTIGFIEVVLGVANIFTIHYFTSVFGFPIWCGLTILLNGVFGVVLKWKQTKCLIATFLALSIVSLVLTVLMLILYSMTLSYFIDGGDTICLYEFRRGSLVCISGGLFPPEQSIGIGLIGFLVLLIICELGCSIGSIVVSCKAYSKCCNTCDADDCCTCFGCCECDSAPLNVQQNVAQQSSNDLHNNGFVPARQLDRLQYDSTSHLPPPSNAIGAHAVGFNSLSCNPAPQTSSSFKDTLPSGGIKQPDV